ncbi:UNKNOWN [Stylonychia lemnae]|uniref:Uncharacterized protein n=1 Tax=Stylonychia lemnae TaxID=5949 RepID=A0A078A3S4_STYLE|nr:UNKNOWN [Stylonychia lemnae]|eukprot:CDW76477.1 UNKNOWN [Stylonychia lemnae]
MIKNADLYDLINISLRQNELKNEQVEQFISKALQQSQSRSQISQNNPCDDQNIDPQQLEIIFTPPSKFSSRAYQQSTSPSKLLRQFEQNANKYDEKKLNNSQNSKQQKQKPEVLPLQQSQRQNTIQSENYNPLVQQIMSQLKNKSNAAIISHLNENSQLLTDLQNQQPRVIVPQPYSHQPESPIRDEIIDDALLQIPHSQQIQQKQQERGFISQEIILAKQKSRNTLAEQKLHTVNEINFKGDQFSFQHKQRESLARKSPNQSSYSTNKDFSQRGGALSQNRSPSKNGQRKYETHLKMQHSLKYQHERQEHLQQQQIMRNLGNVRQFHQNQQALNRSVSSNCIINNETSESLKDLSQFSGSKISQRQNLAQKSFLQISSSKIIEEEVSTTSNKTPRSNRNQALSFIKNSQYQNLGVQNDSIIQLSEEERQKQALYKKSIDQKKQQLGSLFSQMNIKCLTEFERIKKPSQLAYMTGRLVCQFFINFKDSHQNNSKQVHMDDFIEWEEIVKFINNFVIKQNNELLQIIKQRVLSPEQVPHQTIKLLEGKFKSIIDQYFTGENLKIFKHAGTNKTMQSLINFVYGIITNYFDVQAIEKQHNDIFGIDTVEDQYTSRRIDDDKILSQFKSRAETQLDQKRPESSLSRTPISRNQVIGRTQTNPNVENSKIPVPSEQLHKIAEQTEALQKSSSRNLLMRKDRSQLLNKEDQQTNKSQLLKTARDVSFAKTKVDNIEKSVKRTRKNQENTRDQSKSPINQRQKSISKSPISAHRYQQYIPAGSNIINHILQRHATKDQAGINQKQSASPNNQIFKQHKEQSHKILTQVPENDISFEKYLEDNINQDSKTSIIQQNISALMASASQKNIDMKLIEQIKQRRINQLEREKSLEKYPIKYLENPIQLNL